MSLSRHDSIELVLEATEMLIQRVNSLLEDVIVRQTLAPNFGIEWTANESTNDGKVCGWLVQDHASKAIERVLKETSSFIGHTHDVWVRRFVVLENGCLKLYRQSDAGTNKPGKEHTSIDMKSIRDVTCYGGSHNSESIFFFAIDFVTPKKKSDTVEIYLRSIEESNIDLVARWVAILKHRTGTYENYIDKMKTLVNNRIATFQRYYRSRQNASPILKRLASMLLKKPQKILRKPSESDVPSHASVAVPRAIPVRTLGEEDDEVWENERWNIVTLANGSLHRGGWSPENLLSFERIRYTDRAGNPIAESWDELERMMVPDGWKVKTGFVVDASGVDVNKCDSKGWRYESQFNALDSKQAKGEQRSKSSMRWVVRHRRLVRRRVLVDPSVAKRIPCWIKLYGWLGSTGLHRGIMWKSRYSALIDASSLPNGDPSPHGLSVPFVAVFSTKFMEHGPPKSGLESLDWSKLSIKNCRVRILDSTCIVDESIASSTKPGYFSIKFTGESKPCVFNAGSASDRRLWVSSLKDVIAKALSPIKTFYQVNEDAKNPGVWQLLLEHEDVFQKNFHSCPADEETNDDVDTGAATANFPSQFTPPESYENVVWTCEYEIDMDTLVKTLYFDSKFMDQDFQQNGFSNIEIQDWTDESKMGSKRIMSYLMPRAGAVPQNTAYVEQVVIQHFPGVGFQMDQLVKNPEVPFGKTFNTQLRFAIEAKGCSKTTLTVSYEVLFLQNTMMKGFIKSGGLREVTAVFKDRWAPLLKSVLFGGAVSGSSGRFQRPDDFDQVVCDMSFDVPAKRLFELLFETAEFRSRNFQSLDYSNVTVSPWSDGVQPGSAQEITYTIPRSKHVFVTKCRIVQEIKQLFPDTGYQVDAKLYYLDAPRSKSFHSLFQFLMIVGDEPTKSQLVVSHKVESTQSLLARAFIRSRIKDRVQYEFKEYFNPSVWDEISRSSPGLGARMRIPHDIPAEVRAVQKKLYVMYTICMVLVAIVAFLSRELFQLEHLQQDISNRLILLETKTQR